MLNHFHTQQKQHKQLKMRLKKAITVLSFNILKKRSFNEQKKHGI